MLGNLERWGWNMEDCKLCKQTHLHFYYRTLDGRQIIKKCGGCLRETKEDYSEVHNRLAGLCQVNR